MEDLDVKDYEWLEWHAHAFAGLILVPPVLLQTKLAEAVHRARAAGLSLKRTSDVDVAKSYITSWLAKQFDVSRQVVEKRIEKDNIWPKT